MKNVITKIFVVITYVAMVVVNFLASSLPINDRTTGEISNTYPNLFAPAGLTFSIWGLIYLLLAGYVVYQFTKRGEKKEVLITKVNIFFIATSVANISWVFAWHYDYIGLSVIIMAILLYSLIKIADSLRDEQLTLHEKLFVYAPFSVYFGWITVAAIANVTVFLVSIGWNGFGITDFVWTSIILLVGAFIGVFRMVKDKNVVYGFVLVWAYLGILLKHVSVSGFGGQYISVIITILVCLALFGIFVARILIKTK
ncbi:MAG: hypothetical protein R6V23_03065 [Bacteroidales bacterium]